MADPHEEEMQAQFRRPITDLLGSLKTLVQDLEIAAQDTNPEDIKAAVNRAMNWLWNYLNQCSPMAFRREKNGKTAFFWPEADGGRVPIYRWVICRPDGTFFSGRETTQAACERNLKSLLDADLG